jgi:feruloyl-CoA synthase
MPTSLMNTPHRPVRMGSTRGLVERRPDGSFLVRLDEVLQPYPRRLTERLVHWATRTPHQTFMAQRGPGGVGWDRMSYADALARARAVGQSLLDRGLSPARPVMMLSENDLDNQVLALACLHTGIPYVPVSPGYSLLSQDFLKLRHVLDLMTPGLVFAASGRRYDAALTRAVPVGVEIVVSRDPPAGRTATSFGDLLDTMPTAAVDRAFDAITPETIGKVLFTSGTSGPPKGAMFPHRMLTSNRQQVAQCLAFVEDEPPVLVDWLPWHHTFGGTNNVGIALWSGGTYYIDPGRPVAEGIGPTVQALREIGPTLYLNTPGGFEALLPHLRADEALRRTFFSRLQLIYYGGARLPVHIWDELDRLAAATVGQRLLICSGIGSTETGPVPTTTNWDPRREPMVGLPVPGCDVKLVPVAGKLEIRVRGPNVTSGYWRDPDRSQAAFDEEGFFKMGDAATFIDPVRPDAGLRFDGRISDNFKLASGTWVDVVAVRDALVAALAPCLKEAVIAGHDRGFLTALLLPDLAACRALDAALPADADADAVVRSPVVRSHVAAALRTLAARATGSASRVLRAILEAEPATLDTGEVTDKTTISQRAVLERRGASVSALYDEPPGPGVIVAG